MKGGSVGIIELDAITEDPRVVDVDSHKSVKFEATIVVWSRLRI